jgi:folate-binding protein YgfZ
MTNIPTPGSGRLSHLGLLRFAGPDAASFLQGQVSNDTRKLDGQRALLAACSSPQGRVLCLIYLLPHSTGIVAVMPREQLAPTAERLRRYVFRAKVKIDEPGGLLQLYGADDDALRAAGLTPPTGDAGYAETDGIGVARLQHDAARYLLLGSPEKLATLGFSDSLPAVDHAWRLADVRAGIPQVYGANSETFVAQMLNLDLLDGISFSKGCYTGQEIIARTQHLGRIKRRLYRLGLPQGAWQIGQVLQLPDGRQARLTEVVAADDAVEALAVLNIDAGAETRDADATQSSVDVKLLPLPYSLESAA